MTTDTIPEALKAVEEIEEKILFMQPAEKEEAVPIISQAVLAYHKRRLAECGGDARLLAMKLWNKAVLDREGEIEDYDPYDIEKITELLQLHTAKAVEEAMRLKEVLAKAYEDKCDEYRNQITTLQQALSTAETVSHGFQEKAGELQKQCSSLETALADWHKMADQRSEALVKAQQQCEELRQRIATDHLAGVVIELEKERDELRDRLFANISAKEEFHVQLTRLQQDVKPLLGLADSDDPEWKMKTLETFLTAHPECKP